MTNLTKKLALCAVAYLILTTAVLAQGTVTVPWGDWLAAAFPIVGFVLIVLLTVGVAILLPRLPPWVQAVMTPAVQQMLLTYAANAINWGIQKAQGATKGQVLAFDVGNAAVAAAIQDALNTMPQKVVDKLGGVEGVKKWILSQAEDHGLILDPNTTADMILSSPQVRAITGPQKG